jgi:uncharacterized membrane protein
MFTFGIALLIASIIFTVIAFFTPDKLKNIPSLSKKSLWTWVSGACWGIGGYAGLVRFSGNSVDSDMTGWGMGIVILIVLVYNFFRKD